MSHVTDWPQCSACSNRRGSWAPVEEYEVVELKTVIVYRKRIAVIAKCSHGASEDEQRRAWTGTGGQIHEQMSEAINVPTWWGERNIVDAIRSLRFFTPGISRPKHTLVDLITP